MIHALEFLNSSTHMKSEYFSEFVDLEELQSALVPLFKELVHLENTYKSERDRLLKQRLYKAYLLTTMGYCMVKLFVEYLKVRQHIFLTKYLYDTAQNNYDRFQNLSSIQAYLRELKSELHVINNGGVVVGLLGDKKVYDYLNSTIRDFEAVATLEEKVQTKFEDIKKNIFQDIEAIKRESQNLISSFEAWSIPKSFDVIRYR